MVIKGSRVDRGIPHSHGKGTTLVLIPDYTVSHRIRREYSTHFKQPEAPRQSFRTAVTIRQNGLHFALLIHCENQHVSNNQVQQ